jgi:uncharacterized protein YprB with RNaseH-like and TPR domain
MALYFITNNTELQKEIKTLSRDEILPCTISSCLSYLESQDVLGFDIETLGFDPYTDRIVCIQIGNRYSNCRHSNL